MSLENWFEYCAEDGVVTFWHGGPIKNRGELQFKRPFFTMSYIQALDYASDNTMYFFELDKEQYVRIFSTQQDIDEVEELLSDDEEEDGDDEEDAFSWKSKKWALQAKAIDYIFSSDKDCLVAACADGIVFRNLRNYKVYKIEL